MTNETTIEKQLMRIADALERLAPASPAPVDLDGADVFVWLAESGTLRPVAAVNALPLALLKGIERQRDQLLANTRRFAQGRPANNVLLWGARGMGKSSLVKSAHAAVNQESPKALALVEIHREDIASLPVLLHGLRRQSRRVILFCDDLSFEPGDASYKSLKAILEGGVEGRPEHVLFYATSNRRHLMPRDMAQNERSTAINPAEAVDESVSLSDRFGLWLGIHQAGQDDYLAMIDGYAAYFAIAMPPDALHRAALEWAATRGARSGRVAWQFMQTLRD
ncbi:MAG: ATP-binding protein [Alphaproteobacteria bacterium]|nr:MAG: ATP-binding protein [Alphaproteobacteria bacterium]